MSKWLHVNNIINRNSFLEWATVAWKLSPTEVIFMLLVACADVSYFQSLYNLLHAEERVEFLTITKWDWNSYAGMWVCLLSIAVDFITIQRLCEHNIQC